MIACGGGGSGGDSGGTPPPTNLAPRVVAPAVLEVLEGGRLAGAKIDISDPEGDQIQSSNLTGVDAKFFALNKQVGSSSYVLELRQPLDFDDPQDANHDNRYEFDVVASDGRNSATGHVVVQVGNAPGTAFGEEQGMAAILGIKDADQTGNQIGFVGDVDGDGMSEVFVAARRREAAEPVGGVTSRPGSVFVVSGAAVARSKTGTVQLLEQTSGRSVELTWPATLDEQTPGWGFRAMGLADIDGDHLPELAVTSTRWNHAGVVDIVRGSFVASALQNSSTAPQVDAGTTPALRINGDSTNEAFGASIARLPDLDGDGREELLVCAPGGTTSNVYLVFGDTLHSKLASGGEFSVDSAIANHGVVRFAGVNRNERRCMSVASAGDFDGDGKPDVIIGESQGGDVGLAQAHIVYGRAILQARLGTGLITLENLEAGNKGVTLVGEFTLDFFASAVAGIGDFNKDGVDDVAIGAPRSPEDSGSSASVTDKGAVFVLFGSRTPFAKRLSVSDLDAGALGFVIRGTTKFEATGTQISAAGDVNGDGFADFYVSSPGASIDFGGGAPLLTFAGRIDLVFGTNAVFSGGVQLGSFTGRTQIIPFPATHYIEDMAAYGDVDGDGRNDLLVSAPATTRCANNLQISPGGGFYVSRTTIGGATNGMLDLGAHLFGGALPSKYLSFGELQCPIL